MGWRLPHWTLWYRVFLHSFWELVLVYQLYLRYLYVKANRSVPRQIFEVQ